MTARRARRGELRAVAGIGQERDVARAGALERGHTRDANRAVAVERRAGGSREIGEGMAAEARLDGPSWPEHRA